MLILLERKCAQYFTIPCSFSSTSQVLPRVRDYANNSHKNLRSVYR